MSVAAFDATGNGRPEGRSRALGATPACINCAQPFALPDPRVVYQAGGAHVGPFCATCDGVLRRAGAAPQAWTPATSARLHPVAHRLREALLNAGAFTHAVAADFEELARLAADLTEARS